MKLMRRVQMDLFASPTRPPELISSERQKAIALLQALLMEAAIKSGRHSGKRRRAGDRQ